MGNTFIDIEQRLLGSFGLENMNKNSSSASKPLLAISIILKIRVVNSKEKKSLIFKFLLNFVSVEIIFLLALFNSNTSPDSFTIMYPVLISFVTDSMSRLSRR